MYRCPPSCWPAPMRCGRQWPRKRPGWVRAGGCSSGRAGPSRWFGSWWRPPAMVWPRRSPSVSAPWSGTSCGPPRQPRIEPEATPVDMLIEGAGIVGVGVDAVDIARLRHMLVRRAGLAGRLFTDGERAYAARAADGAPRFATRFAAKEATMKALGVGLGAFPIRQVEVVRVDLDAPTLVLHGAAAELARRAGVLRWHLSLSLI